MSKKAAIVGTGSGEMDAPFSDENYDIFVLNWNIPKYPRVTLGFEMHEMRKGKPVEPEEYKDDVTGNIVPTITQANFPHDKVKALNRRYFSDGNYYKSSVDYMLAYAIVEDYSAIEIYGVDMAVDDDEYFRQQPSVRSWISLAIGMGIDVTVCDSSPLMKSTYIYGKDANRVCTKPFTRGDFEECRKQHEDWINDLAKQNQELKGKIDANLRAIDTHNGVAQVFDRLAKVARAIEAGEKIEKLSTTAKLR